MKTLPTVLRWTKLIIYNVCGKRLLKIIESLNTYISDRFVFQFKRQFTDTISQKNKKNVWTVKFVWHKISNKNSILKIFIKSFSLKTVKKILELVSIVCTESLIGSSLFLRLWSLPPTFSKPVCPRKRYLCHSSIPVLNLDECRSHRLVSSVAQGPGSHSVYWNLHN